MEVRVPTCCRASGAKKPSYYIERNVICKAQACPVACKTRQGSRILFRYCLAPITTVEMSPLDGSYAEHSLKLDHLHHHEAQVQSEEVRKGYRNRMTENCSPGRRPTQPCLATGKEGLPNVGP